VTKPTTIRLPKDLLAALDQRARRRNQDRASYIRELLAEALARDREREVLRAYREGSVSMSEAISQLDVDPWAWFELLRRHNLTLNVQLEDWIDSRPAVR
jgi:Arc/MetJ-type ribon-helix-helix transcriptional regulator